MQHIITSRFGSKTLWLSRLPADRQRIGPFDIGGIGGYTFPSIFLARDNNFVLEIRFFINCCFFF